MPPKLATNVVAMVGTQAITAEDLQSELTRRGHGGVGMDEAGEKQAVLSEMIAFEVLHQRALAEGYGQNPQIVASLKRMIVAKFQEDQMASLRATPVTAEEIERYYEENPRRFGVPERIRAAVIELGVPRTASEERRAEVAARAATVLAEAQTNTVSDHTFGLLAQRHSEHQPSRYRGGDMGWLTMGVSNAAWPPAVLDALVKLSEPGDISPVIETPTAFYIVRLVEKQAAKARPLREMKDGVAYLVAREREQRQRKDLLNKLQQGLAIQTNQALLNAIWAPSRQAEPPEVSGGPAKKTR